MIKTVDSYCRGCRYLVHFGKFGVAKACDYIVATGKRRPCPAGKGCTVRKVSQRRTRWKPLQVK